MRWPAIEHEASAASPGGASTPVALTSALTATGILANALLLPVLPDLVADFGRGPTAGGLLLAVGTAPGILLAPVLGSIADRAGRRAVLVPSLLSFAAGSVGMALAASWAVLVACRVVQGVGAVALVSLAVVLLGDQYRGADLTRRLGANAAVLTFTSAVVPLVSGALGDAFGPQAPLWIGLVGVPLALVVRDRLPRERPPVPLDRAPLLPLLRRRSLALPLLVGTVMFVVLFGPARAGLTFALVERFGTASTERGLVLLLAQAPSVVTSLLLARAVRTPGPRTLAAAFGVLTVGMLGLSVAPTIGVFVVAAALTGAADGLTVPLLQGRVTRATPLANRAAVMSVWSGGVRVGQSAGPLAAGLVLSAASSTALFAGAAVLTAALSVAATRFDPTARPDHTHSGPADRPG